MSRACFVAGSERWDDPDAIIRFLDSISDETVLLHRGRGGWRNGHLLGADALIDHYARHRGREVHRIPGHLGGVFYRLNTARKEGHGTQVVIFHEDAERDRDAAQVMRLARFSGHPVTIIEG